MKHDAFKHYLRDLGFLVREQAKAAKLRALETKDDPSHDFELGQSFAWYSVVSLMQQQAVAFEIPLVELALDGVDPDRDLLV